MKYLIVTAILSFISLQSRAEYQMYSNDGQYLGNLNNNQYDPNSISNTYGRYGNSYSPDSVNNPYGQYGNPYSPNSVTNQYAQPPVIIKRW